MDAGLASEGRMGGRREGPEASRREGPEASRARLYEAESSTPRLGEEGEQGGVACPICFEAPPGGMSQSVAARLLKCKHLACDECMVAHARARILGEGDLTLLVCPAVGCKVGMPDSAVRELGGMPGGGGLVERYVMLSAASFVNNCAQEQWCPASGCGQSVGLPAGAGARAVPVTCG